MTKGKYSIPDEEVFIDNVLTSFQSLIEKFGYIQTNVTKKRSYAAVIYKNELIKRRIEISNQTNPVDYGFSIFIYNTSDEEYNIAVNVPWDKEDKECRFVERSSKFFFETLLSLIAGTEWTTFGRILRQE